MLFCRERVHAALISPVLMTGSVLAYKWQSRGLVLTNSKADLALFSKRQ